MKSRGTLMIKVSRMSDCLEGLRVDILGHVQAGIDPKDRDAWFRVFGYGLSVKDTRGRDLLFSDRNKVGACFQVGPWLLRALAPIQEKGAAS